jgi:hypothetical protein
MTQKEELKILRSLLWKIGNAAAGFNTERLKVIIGEIQDYCYNQSNGDAGKTDLEFEKQRIGSLKRLDEI